MVTSFRRNINLFDILYQINGVMLIYVCRGHKKPSLTTFVFTSNGHFFLPEKPSIYVLFYELKNKIQICTGIAETYLMKAVGTSTGQTLAQVKAAVQKCGDLGKAAEAARQKQRVMFPAPPLTTRKVYRALREVAACSGKF